ncbi:MAG: hypothetical protein J6Q69_00785 [Clostridia bacterium]|nr:hypothetical protein [Clostridia bacterium]
MKDLRKIEKFLLSACAYTVGVTLLFFLIGSIFYSVVLELASFLVCILMGVTISLANLISKIRSIKIWFRVPMHFAVLLGMWILFLYTAASNAMDGSGRVFVAIVIYTVFYAAAFAIVCAIKALIKHLDDKAEVIAKNKNSKNSKDKNGKYSPRFK